VLKPDHAADLLCIFARQNFAGFLRHKYECMLFFCVGFSEMSFFTRLKASLFNLTCFVPSTTLESRGPSLLGQAFLLNKNWPHSCIIVWMPNFTIAANKSGTVWYVVIIYSICERRDRDLKPFLQKLRYMHLIIIQKKTFLFYIQCVYEFRLFI
jgi:hypothetical protein